MEDADIIRKIKKGDTDSFAFIVEKYQNHVFNVAKKITGDYDTSLDITQETFLKFFRSIRNFDEDRPVFPYLVRIAANCAKDRIKKKQREAEIRGKIPQTRETGNADKIEKLFSLIYELPEKQREALLLHYRDGKSVKEIAAKMNISVSNAKVLLFRGRKALFILWKETE